MSERVLLLARWLVTTLDGVILLYTVDRDADRALAVLDALVDALTSRITTGAHARAMADHAG